MVFDFYLLLNAFLSEYKKMDKKSSLSNSIFIKNILVVDDVLLLS
jgi:hypothetical protein